MHTAVFAQAALPAPVRVLGLRLRPYSLGHELWLAREQNPLALSCDRCPMSSVLQALPQAVLACAQTFPEIEGMRRDRLLPLKFILWNFRLRRCNFAAELAAFLEYRTRGTLCFPDEPPDPLDNPGRPVGAPLLLSLHAFVLTLGTAEISHYGPSAWDYPYGLAQMRYATALEVEGRWKIKNRIEAAHDAAAAEWEATHPGSTLKLEGSKASPSPPSDGGEGRGEVVSKN